VAATVPAEGSWKGVIFFCVSGSKREKKEGGGEKGVGDAPLKAYRKKGGIGQKTLPVLG